MPDNPDELVETLSDLFPKFSKSDLKFRIGLTNDINQLIEELFAESETEYDATVYQLYEMFPNLPLDFLSQKLQEYNNDLETTAMHLLQPITTTTTNQWNQMDDIITKIQNYFIEYNLEKSDIIHYVRLNKGDYYDSMIGIISNCRPRVVQTTSSGGRVQRGAKKSTSLTKYITSTYKYDTRSQEAQELWSFYNSNPQLQTINKQLLINCLEFFQGQVYKVIEFITELISNKPQGKPIIKVELTPRQTATKTTTTRLEQELTSLEQKQFNNYITNHKIDLHNFSLPSSIKLLKLVLQHWWDQELAYRQDHGKFEKFTSLASIGSLTIITGRGIHSIGGVSPIKQYVLQYLTKTDYIFQEKIGSFEVKGRRL
ncbi:Ubiquitin-binding protein CUE2 [Spathaspora sp. JA1]|nr:Ubiquitin-binding protein CUE2 [Spathaspora sp. JA1]